MRRGHSEKAPFFLPEEKVEEVDLYRYIGRERALGALYPLSVSFYPFFMVVFELRSAVALYYKAQLEGR